MLKYLIPIGIGLLIFITLLIIIPRLITAKYSGATIRIFNKTLKGVSVAYIGKIVTERRKTNVIKYPYVNSLFLCKPSGKKDAKEEYYTYSNLRGKLYYLESPKPNFEKTNTEEKSAYHEIVLKPFDKMVLNYVFRNY